MSSNRDQEVAETIHLTNMSGITRPEARHFR